MNVINLPNKKELPIHKQPTLRGFTHHANMCSICESYNAVDDLNADIDILNYDDTKKWSISTNNSMIQLEQNNLKVYSDKYDDKMQAYFYKDCDINEEIVIKINRQIFTSKYASISIVLDIKPFVADQNRNFPFDFGSYSNSEIYVRKNGYIHSIPSLAKEEFPKYLKLSKFHKEVVVSYSEDNVGDHWIEHGRYTFDEITEDMKLYIGININMNESQWYNWFFTNMIQLKCNPYSNNVHADYYLSLSRNYKYNNLNMFLDYNKLDIKLVNDFNGNVSDFIKLSIKNNYYIEINLNEFYIKERDSYQKNDRDHVNLIYGYDDERKVFMSMGISSNGPLCYTDISYSDFDNALKNCSTLEYITTIKYNPDVHFYYLNLKCMIKFLREYLSGYNSSIDCSYFLPETPEYFGIKIYDNYLDDNNFPIFLKDKRISYIICEHKKIMHERIKFLIKRRVLSESEGAEFLVQTKELLEISNVLMMLVIKNQLKEDVNIYPKIINILKELKEKEIIIYKRLIEVLEKWDDKK